MFSLFIWKYQHEPCNTTTSCVQHQSCLPLAKCSLSYMVMVWFASFYHECHVPEEEPSLLSLWDWHSSEPWPLCPGFNCSFCLLLFTDCSVADKVHVSLRKMYGKGRGGDTGGGVYVTAECRTEPLVFQRGCWRSLKCAIDKEFLKEHLFSDESLYLALYSCS